MNSMEENRIHVGNKLHERKPAKCSFDEKLGQWDSGSFCKCTVNLIERAACSIHLRAVWLAIM